MLEMTITEMEKDQWLSGLGRGEGRVGYEYRRDIGGELSEGLGDEGCAIKGNANFPGSIPQKEE